MKKKGVYKEDNYIVFVFLILLDRCVSTNVVLYNKTLSLYEISYPYESNFYVIQCSYK